ncbi:MAG TPA: DUF1080 domain-containing protein [Clostridia bacterium]|nr:DUF1080 domain-containing protein [Clostridia bacterium]
MQLKPLIWIALLILCPLKGHSQEQPAVARACIDGTGPGWRTLDLSDFTNVNCYSNTWSWTNGMIHCSGQPIGVMRTVKVYTNFEAVLHWRHATSGGNSGVFVWASEAALKDLTPDTLPPGGIEVQILDHGYAEQYERTQKKKPDWFSTNGDVFAVGKSTMRPFPPLSPGGHRSFPRKLLSKGFGQWNHYYIRAINGEVRLWVNGEEVSGGNQCNPAFGYLCLESEGAPIDFKDFKIRELP